MLVYFELYPKERRTRLFNRNIFKYVYKRNSERFSVSHHHYRITTTIPTYADLQKPHTQWLIFYFYCQFSHVWDEGRGAHRARTTAIKEEGLVKLWKEIRHQTICLHRWNYYFLFPLWHSLDRLCQNLVKKIERLKSSPKYSPWLPFLFVELIVKSFAT